MYISVRIISKVGKFSPFSSKEVSCQFLLHFLPLQASIYVFQNTATMGRRACWPCAKHRIRHYVHVSLDSHNISVSLLLSILIEQFKNKENITKPKTLEC